MKTLLSALFLLVSATAYSKGMNVTLHKDVINSNLVCDQDDGSLDCSYYDLISKAQKHAATNGGEYLGYEIVPGQDRLRDGQNDIKIMVKYLR